MAIIANMGRVIVIGLEEKNIEKLKRGEPFHQYLEDKIGIPHDIVIFYGKDMEALEKITKDMTGPNTIVKDHRSRRKQ